MQEIAHWWNRRWGCLARRDVWLSQRPDGVFEIRWAGGDWGERFGRDGHQWGRDGLCWRREPAGALTALRSLLGDDLDAWCDLSALGRRSGVSRPELDAGNQAERS